MKSILRLCKKTLTFINGKLAVLSGILLSVMMVLLIINIVSREAGKSIQGLSSASVLIMIIVIYIGMSHTEQKGEHANVDILPSILSPVANKINILLVDIIKFLTLLFFFTGSISQFKKSYQVNEVIADVVNIPVWPSKLAISIGLLFFLLQVGLHIILNLIPKQIKDEL